MKRFILAAVLVAASLTPWGQTNAQLVDGINYRLDLDDFSGPPSGIVHIPVMLKNAIPIGGMVIRIEYDTSFLKPVTISIEEDVIYYDSLELIGRGWNTIVIDSVTSAPLWDTIYCVRPHHNTGEISGNIQPMFINFLPPSETPDPEFYTIPFIETEIGDPTTIFDLLFTVNPGVIPGQTSEVSIKNDMFGDLRVVQLTDTSGTMFIEPGSGPVFADAIFTVDAYFCGDADDDGQINILDLVFLINYLYNGDVAPDPIERADVNSSGNVNLLDITYLISYLYNGGPAPNCP